VAGALPSFVFQLPGELKSFQNGPCATQIFTFGRRPQPQLRQGDCLDTPCSCKIWAPARPKYKGSPCEELWHDPTEHRLSTPTTMRAARSSQKTNCQRPRSDTTRKQGSQQDLTHNLEMKEENKVWHRLAFTPTSYTTPAPQPRTKVESFQLAEITLRDCTHCQHPKNRST